MHFVPRPKMRSEYESNAVCSLVTKQFIAQSDWTKSPALRKNSTYRVSPVA